MFSTEGYNDIAAAVAPEMRVNMSSIASLSSPGTSTYHSLGSSSGVSGATTSDEATNFSSYLVGDCETDTTQKPVPAGPLPSAQDNEILQQISAGDPKLGAKFEKDMKSGNRKGILNDIQNALHEQLISKDAASQFMKQPDMEKKFKGSHMATKQGYKDVVNEDDSRGFDGGKGGSDLLAAGRKYDFDQVAKFILPILTLPLLAIPGVGELAMGAGLAADAVAAGVAEGVAVAADAGAAGAGAAGAAADAVAGAGSIADSVGSTVSEAISPLTDLASNAVQPVADLFGTTPADLGDTVSDVADNASDAVSLSQRLNEQAQNTNQQQSSPQQQAYLQQLALEQAQFAVGA